MRYILRRILLVFPMLLGISLISFTLLNFAPGDPLTAMLNPEEVNVLSEEQLEAERDRLGRNDPLPVR